LCGTLELGLNGIFLGLNGIDFWDFRDFNIPNPKNPKNQSYLIPKNPI
jgi:hypothetical protein